MGISLAEIFVTHVSNSSLLSTPSAAIASFCLGSTMETTTQLSLGVSSATRVMSRNCPEPAKVSLEPWPLLPMYFLCRLFEVPSEKKASSGFSLMAFFLPSSPT